MVNIIGNLNMDLILAQVKRRPDFGEEHTVDHMVLRPGGIANMVYPLEKLGIKPHVIATLGKDYYGDKIYNEISPFIRDGITRTESQTALSVAIVDTVGNRFFVTYNGNLLEFHLTTVEKVTGLDKARASFFYGYFLLPNYGLQGTLSSLKRAKRHHQQTFFDANSDVDGWSEKKREEIYRLLPFIDYFMPNDEELLELTGKRTIEDAIQTLLSKGATNIVVKQGPKGATCYHAGHLFYDEGFPLQAFDTTGAGDSFNAGFLYSRLQGDSIEKSLVFANALASIVVSRKKNRYPKLAEIEERMAEGRRVYGR